MLSRIKDVITNIFIIFLLTIAACLSMLVFIAVGTWAFIALVIVVLIGIPFYLWQGMRK